MRRRDFITALGGAAASPLTWPRAAHAQQRAVPVIGYLTEGPETPTPGFGGAEDPFYAAIRIGLREQGFVEGRNVEILYRTTLQYDRLPIMAAELVRREVTVIFAGGSPAALAAKSATGTIPIVFAMGGDPIESGLVASLNRPATNLTGVTVRATELVAKRLELLHEMIPAATSVGFLVNPTNSQFEADMKEALVAARSLGVRLVILNASSPIEIEGAFTTAIAQRIGALLVAGDPLFAVRASDSLRWPRATSVPQCITFGTMSRLVVS